MLRLICDREQSLKEFTDNNYAQASFYWNYLIKNREIKVNGKKVSCDVILRPGDEICYYLTPKQSEKTAFFVLFEDKNVCVVDKESGVNSEAVFAALARERECYFIHRLDRNTKGLMLFALNKTAENELLAAFKERRIEKRYEALCFGQFPKSQDVLTAYLKKSEKTATVSVFDREIEESEKIVTEYQVISFAQGVTRVEITLHTGKTHQIRAHLAHIGNPIVGDMKYGDTRKNKEMDMARQCLIAKRIRCSFVGELAYLNEKIFFSRFSFSSHAEE